MKISRWLVVGSFWDLVLLMYCSSTIARLPLARSSTALVSETIVGWRYNQRQRPLYHGFSRDSIEFRGAMFMSSSSSTVGSSSSSVLFPRAAVSVCVACTVPNNHNDNDDDAPMAAQPNQRCVFLLVQRGKPPHQGQWSLPGGKVRYGESTLAAAQRELAEETGLASTGNKHNLVWYNGTAMAVDSVGEGFHFVIAQCYAELKSSSSKTGISAETTPWPPPIVAMDDAAAADWFDLSAIRTLQDAQQTTPGLYTVVQRLDQLSRAHFLPTTTTTTTSSSSSSNSV
jgi:ADP-ribose pyrophosphatase YjhB (NUDIX family)